jgi:hypothetical protein
MTPIANCRHGSGSMIVSSLVKRSRATSRMLAVARNLARGAPGNVRSANARSRT